MRIYLYAHLLSCTPRASVVIELLFDDAHLFFSFEHITILENSVRLLIRVLLNGESVPARALQSAVGVFDRFYHCVRAQEVVEYLKIYIDLRFILALVLMLIQGTDQVHLHDVRKRSDIF